MALSDVALSAGLATANPLLIGVGVFGKLIGGGNQRRSANRLADLETRRATAQNAIFAEQTANEKANLLQQRRGIIRQGAKAAAGLQVQEVAQTGGRSSARARVQRSIDDQIGGNVANIDRSIASGARISALNEQISDIQVEASKEQANAAISNQIF